MKPLIFVLMLLTWPALAQQPCDAPCRSIRQIMNDKINRRVEEMKARAAEKQKAMDEQAAQAKALGLAQPSTPSGQAP